MSRKQSSHRPIAVRPPPGLRPKLTRERLCELGLIHIGLVDSLVSGTADLNVLWEWMAGVLTWSRVAQACQLGEQEIDVVATLAVTLAERYERTGQIALSEPEKDVMREGSVVMDLLAQSVDLCTAEAVADWSRSHIASLKLPPQRSN